MATVQTVNGAHHLRIYSSVNINANGALIVDDGAGKPKRLPDGKLVIGQGERLLNKSGQPVRLQQSIKLVDQDDGLHKNDNSPAVSRLRAAKEEEIQTWEAAAESGEDRRPDADMTVAEFFYRIFLPQMTLELTPSTIKSYRGYWDAYLKDHFNGTKTLRGYEAYTATNFLETLAKEYAKHTVMHARAVASAIFAYAISKGYIVAAVGETKNPWRDARKNIKCKRVKDTVAYNQMDVERILDALETITGRQSYSAKLAGMIVSTCFYAGLRPSEAAGLRWENVNLDEGGLYICGAFVVGKHKDTTKTSENRTVVMLPTLRHRLKIWATENQHPKDGLVFPNQSGDAPVNINDLGDRIIEPTLTKVGLTWHGLYACRRGYGTALFEAGATVEEIAANMGNSVEVAFKNYVKSKGKTAARGMEKLAAAMAAGDRQLGGQKVLTAGVHNV
jgi:integrase